jgi:hypothetical protein
MATQPVDQISFINFFPEITDENNLKILDIWNSFRVRVIPQELSIEAYDEYTVKSTDTLHMLAYRYYGDVRMWWVIPMINDAEDPFDFLKDAVDSSKTIKILKPPLISSIMFSVARMKNAKDKR